MDPNILPEKIWETKIASRDSNPVKIKKRLLFRSLFRPRKSRKTIKERHRLAGTAGKDFQQWKCMTTSKIIH